MWIFFFSGVDPISGSLGKDLWRAGTKLWTFDPPSGRSAGHVAIGDMIPQQLVLSHDHLGFTNKSMGYFQTVAGMRLILMLFSSFLHDFHSFWNCPIFRQKYSHSQRTDTMDASERWVTVPSSQKWIHPRNPGLVLDLCILRDHVAWYSISREVFYIKGRNDFTAFNLLPILEFSAGIWVCLKIGGTPISCGENEVLNHGMVRFPKSKCCRKHMFVQ